MVVSVSVLTSLAPSDCWGWIGKVWYREEQKDFVLNCTAFNSIINILPVHKLWMVPHYLRHNFVITLSVFFFLNGPYVTHILNSDYWLEVNTVTVSQTWMSSSVAHCSDWFCMLKWMKVPALILVWEGYYSSHQIDSYGTIPNTLLWRLQINLTFLRIFWYFRWSGDPANHGVPTTGQPSRVFAQTPSWVYTESVVRATDLPGNYFLSYRNWFIEKLK